MKRPGPQVCRYAADRPIRIGSANTDDITVKEKGIGPHRFQLDPLQKMIEDRGSGMQGLLNQEKFSGKVSFKDWDLFSIGLLRIVLERNALWILSNEKVIVHLPETSAVSDYTLQFPPLRSMRLHAQMVRERPPQKLSASVPVRRQPTLRKPHFAEYLPSLMMSLAAAVSVLSSWFTNPDMPITAWVMPLCMLGVHLMLFPLRRLAYRQEAKRQKEAEDRRIEQLRKQEIMRIKEFKEAHTAWNDAFFPNALQLERFLNSFRIGTRDRDSYAGNRICLGEAQGLLMVQLSHGAEDDAESLRILSEACADMQRQKSSWILDLAEYRRIRIRTTDLQKAFCRYLILQAALYFHPSEYVFVFSFGRSADLEEFRGLLQVYGEKERRWLISTSADAAEAKRILAAEERTVILFAEAGREYGLCDCADTAFLLETEMQGYSGKTDLDLTIDSFASYAEDHICHTERIFHCELPEHSEEVFQNCISRLHLEGYKQPYKSYMQYLEVCGISIEDIAENWKKGDPDQSIKALIGSDETGEVIVLDLHESGDGPHGLLAGTTGSGKSELLVTMLLSLAMQYSPEDLQFVVIDFKGGASVQAFESAEGNLPHLAGTLNDLDVTDVRRAVAGLKEECRYRKRCFQKLHEATGRPVTSLAQYRAICKEQANGVNLAYLLIVADEYAELKQSYPEFPDELVRIARTGRSLGIHLLLCTQKPAGTVNDQIRSNTAYRICLKTADAQDSMEVLRCKDAADLNRAGAFFLQTDTRMVKGQACYAREKLVRNRPRVQLYDRMHRLLADSLMQAEGKTTLEVLTKRIHAAGRDRMARGIWLPRPKYPSMQCLSAVSGGFALADDAENRKILPLSVYDSNALAFFTADRAAKQNCMYTLLWSLLMSRAQADELYVIDDLFISLEGLQEALDGCWIFSSRENDRCRQLYEKIRKRSFKEKGRCTVIITDCGHFYENGLDHGNILHDLLEHGQDHSVRCIVFASISSAFRYRDLSLITDRYYLCTDNLNDLSSVMETAVHVPVKDPFSGYCRRERLMEFYLPEISIEQVQKEAERRNRGG